MIEIVEKQSRINAIGFLFGISYAFSDTTEIVFSKKMKNYPSFGSLQLFVNLMSTGNLRRAPSIRPRSHENSASGAWTMRR